MNKVVLYEEYRLVEKNESDISGVWKGAHLLLFLLAFVFGSFCTICFHVLMYMFDEKCILFPKFVSLSSVSQSVIDEFKPPQRTGKINNEVLEFFVTQWLDKSACYMPAYVPLVSGIFGVIWTTMFLMCNSGSWNLSGLLRPWWILPFVFIFSLAMSGLCVYSSYITHSGMNELIIKLCNITGDNTCTYTINVATLVYRKHIRGVYEAIILTLLSAWLHTACWVLSAILSLSRMILVVDFQLVKVKVELKGDLEKIMERQEQQLRTVTPDRSQRKKLDSTGTATKDSTVTIHYENKLYHKTPSSSYLVSSIPLSASGYFKYINEGVNTDISTISNYSLQPGERLKNIKNTASKIIENPQRIPRLLFGDVDASSRTPSVSSADSSLTFEVEKKIKRQKGQCTLDKVSVDEIFARLSDTSSKKGSVLEAVSDLDKASKTGSNLSIFSEMELAEVDLVTDSDTYSIISERRKKKVLIEPKPQIMASKADSAESVRSNASKASKTSKKKKKKEKED